MQKVLVNKQSTSLYCQNRGCLHKILFTQHSIKRTPPFLYNGIIVPFQSSGNSNAIYGNFKLNDSNLVKTGVLL